MKTGKHISNRAVIKSWKVDCAEDASEDRRGHCNPRATGEEKKQYAADHRRAVSRDEAVDLPYPGQGVGGIQNNS